MLELSVSSSVYNAVVPIERRITYIRGDSGVGKTSLVNVIIDYNNEVQGIKVDFPYNIEVLQNVPKEEVLVAYKDCMLVFDDSLSTEINMSVFNKLCPKNNLYVLVINRVDSEESEKGILSGIKFSVNSILVCNKDGVNHYFKPFYESNNFLSESWETEKVSIIITEGTYGLTDMKDLLGVKCVSSKGNMNISKESDKLILDGEDNILVCADWSSFGSKFSDFYELYRSSGKKIFVDFNYKCFEYMLLMSNMLKDDFKFDINKANTYESWENYFEAELEQITANTFYLYKHGKPLRDCYTGACLSGHCNKYIYSMYRKAFDGDKINYLFKNTVVDYMRYISTLGGKNE